MAELLVQQCAACQHRMFPRRLACSNCGGMTALTKDQASNGIEWAQRNRQMQ